MDYVIDGAYRAKKQFTCVNGWPGLVLQYHYGFHPVVEVDTKAILQGKLPASGTPNHLLIYTVTPNGMDWVLQMRIPRFQFDQYFEKMPLSIATNPALMMKIKMVHQTYVAEPLQR